MDLTDKKNVIEILSSHHLWSRKRLGQHFLIDREILDKIVGEAQLSFNDLVIEVGPGLGVLTRELIKSAGQVLAVEIDRNMVKILKENIKSSNLEIVEKNILNLNLAEILTKSKKVRYKVVANLPYNITSPALRFFLENEIKPEMMVVLVQKEVAERICAKPGSRERGYLSILAQFFGEPQFIAQVPRQSFFPIPKVDSAILKISNVHYPQNDLDLKLFFQVVKAGFSSKRKQIHNSLGAGMQFSKETTLKVLKKAGISPQVRAEDLTMNQWKRLTKIIKKIGLR